MIQSALQDAIEKHSDRSEEESPVDRGSEREGQKRLSQVLSDSLTNKSTELGKQVRDVKEKVSFFHRLF